MEHTKLVTASELEDFSDRRDSEPVIPELVHLLVTLSLTDLTHCRIPYGDSIGLPGLDGLVKQKLAFDSSFPRKRAFGRSVVARMLKEKQPKITIKELRKYVLQIVPGQPLSS